MRIVRAGPVIACDGGRRDVDPKSVYEVVGAFLSQEGVVSEGRSWGRGNARIRPQLSVVSAGADGLVTAVLLRGGTLEYSCALEEWTNGFPV